MKIVMPPFPTCFDTSLKGDTVKTVPYTAPISDGNNNNTVSDNKKLCKLATKLLSLPSCNPNIADANGDSPLFTALKIGNNELVANIIQSKSFDANHKYNDGTNNIIKLTNVINAFDVFDEKSEIYLYVLNTLLKNKNISLVTMDFCDKNALMYAASKDNNIVLKKMLECNILTSDLNNLLVYVNSLHLIINANLIKTKITANASKSSTGKWLFFF